MNFQHAIIEVKVNHYESKKEISKYDVINYLPIILIWIIWISFMNSNFLNSSYYLQFKWYSFFPLMVITVVSEVFRFSHNAKLILLNDKIVLQKKSGITFEYLNNVESIKIFNQKWKSNLFNRNISLVLTTKNKNVTILVFERSLFIKGKMKYELFLKKSNSLIEEYNIDFNSSINKNLPRKLINYYSNSFSNNEEI